MGKPTNGAATAAPDELLALSTTTSGPRRRVSIDGRLFDLVPGDALTLIAMRRARRAAARVSAILAADENAITSEMEHDFKAASLDVLTCILPDAPRKLLEALPDAARVRLLGFFTETTRATITPPSPTSIRKRRSRRGFKDSTAAARAIG